VFEMAKDYGLVLLENGSLVDTAAGEALPIDSKPMVPTSADEAAALQRMMAAQAQGLVVRDGNAGGSAVTAIIGETGPIDWEHGFCMERLDIGAGEEIEWDRDDGVDVLFIHRGHATIPCADGTLMLGEGDTMSLPAGLRRMVQSDGGAVAFLVHRA